MSVSVSTVGVGQIGFFPTILVIGGSSGYRFVTKNTRLLIDRSIFSINNMSSIDFSLRIQDMKLSYDYVNNLIGYYTNMNLEEKKIPSSMEGYSSEEAKKFGLIDDILESF
uniref:ATP-dependent Clp protease proteolytic subunit n=1 Tax=Gloeochaete wittrockiana TaxID=38269 RepID=A0A3G1IVU6_9EUKA|nr:ATP-dependent Clp protease proteolytic subunit [Gloeochaete wittrockiana]ASQ40178.1 ATP-dependent Clp protease proteolytic subunit [Gloeochaete wittrockiana]